MDQETRRKKLIDGLSNPACARLLLELMRRGETTAKQLAGACPEIPPTTLYRHLRRLTEDGLLRVVRETQIRGTVERTYALTFDLSDPQSLFGESPGEVYLQMFLQYILNFARQFQAYCAQPGIDIVGDRSGFSLAHAYLTDEELEAAAQAIGGVLSGLQANGPGPGRRLRTIGLIVSPERKDDS